jgi:phenylalanine-4-hydroxylase
MRGAESNGPSATLTVGVMSSDTAIPPHLRKYVVEQDYSAYSARDQAVWRFVVGHTHRRLWDSAHSSYRTGFRRAGISTERIPNLREMSAELLATGFSVVCVDGFIPPRAFQAFQARGYLPVAADIRTAEHLTYTPAPDIIHEAAGHAPFLAHPDYARFLRRIGAVSERAFESAHDRAMYRAIHTLSELKEQPDSTPAQVAAAEAELSALSAAKTETSEATRLARLYWWTVEYGLVGRLDDYRLYGAGLLSSIGEAHFCHDPRVRKLALSAACVDVDYDITQAQPQLFVAEDFAQLDAVLSEVEAGLSHVRGGEAALSRARDSEELATLVLDNDLELAGTLRAFDSGSLRLSGRCAIARAGALLPELALHEQGYLLPLGALEDGTPLSALSQATLQRYQHGRRLSLATQAGLRIEGELLALHQHEGRVYAALLQGLCIERGAERLLEARAPYPLLFASRVQTALPLAPEGYYPATDYPTLRVPKPRNIPEAERALIALHAQVAALVRAPAEDANERLQAIHGALGAYPTEWLLRINLLEALLAGGCPDHALESRLRRELTELEVHFQGREPIATGLSSY